MTDIRNMSPVEVHRVKINHEEQRVKEDRAVYALDKQYSQIKTANDEVNQLHYDLRHVVTNLQAGTNELSARQVHELLIKMDEAVGAQVNAIDALQTVLSEIRYTRDNYGRQSVSFAELLTAFVNNQSQVLNARASMRELILTVCGQAENTIDRNSILPAMENVATALDMKIEVKAVPTMPAVSDTGTDPQVLAPMTEIEFELRFKQATDAKSLFSLLTDINTRGYPKGVNAESTFGKLMSNAVSTFTQEYFIPAIADAIDAYNGTDLVLIGHTRPRKWGFDNPYEDWGFHALKDASILNTHLPAWTLKKPFLRESDQSMLDRLQASLAGQGFCAKAPFFDAFGFTRNLPAYEMNDYAKRPDFADVVDLYMDRAKQKAAQAIDEGIEAALVDTSITAADRICNEYRYQRILAQLKTLPHDYPILQFSDAYGYDFNALVLPREVLTTVREKLDLPETFNNVRTGFSIDIPLMEMDW